MNDDERDRHEPDEIPLLEDVVTPEQLEIESEFILFEEEETTPTESDAPRYDATLPALRDEIAAQLQADLQSLVGQALDQAILEITQRLSRSLHEQLDDTLQRRIRSLIEQRLEREFGPRE